MCAVVEKSAPDYVTHSERSLSTFTHWERRFSFSCSVLGTFQRHSAETETVLSNDMLSIIKHHLLHKIEEGFADQKAVLMG